MDLIEVGNHRVVLNFTAVERLGSWIIGRRGQCPSAVRGGGRRQAQDLRARPPARRDLLDRRHDRGDRTCTPTRPRPSRAPGPDVLAPRQLPVDILASSAAAGELPPIRGGSPEARSRAEAQQALREPARGSEPPATPTHGSAMATSACRSRWDRARAGRSRVRLPARDRPRPRVPPPARLRAGEQAARRDRAARRRRVFLRPGQHQRHADQRPAHPRPRGRVHRRRSDPDRADRLDPVDRSAAQRGGGDRSKITPRGGCRSKVRGSPSRPTESITTEELPFSTSSTPSDGSSTR